MVANRQRVDRTDRLPSCSLGERDRRWGAVRERMAQRRIDALVVWGTDDAWGMAKANLRYLTQVPGQEFGIGLFLRDDPPTVWSDLPHKHEPYNVYSIYQDWTEDVRTFTGMDAIADAIADHGLDESRIGIVGSASHLSGLSIPHSQYVRLKTRLPGAELVECTDLVEQARMVKSDEELAYLREAGEIASRMAERLMDAEPGRRECEVFADMVHEQLASGGEAYVFNMMDSGDPKTDAEQHLLHGKSQPMAPSRRVLEEGDLIVTEYHANMGGYLVAAEKSVALGSVPSELEAIHEVCLQCNESGIEAMTPGTQLAEVLEAFRSPVHEADMDFLELGFHGHGLGSPEFPVVVYPREGTERYPDGMTEYPLAGVGVEGMRLREGMVFGTNVDVYDPNWRNDVGIQYGDTIVVTADGPERLVETPTDLVV